MRNTRLNEGKSIKIKYIPSILLLGDKLSEPYDLHTLICIRIPRLAWTLC